MRTYDSISLKKPTLKGFNALKRCAYELTGQAAYLGNDMYFEETNRGTICFNLIYNFWWIKKEVQKLVEAGYVCRYTLSDVNGKLPYVYNRLLF